MSFKVLSDRDHLILRPAMYIGAVDLTKKEEYVFDNGKIELREIEYVPGLIKIINELIDNSVDVAIKTNFKSSTQISVKMTSDMVEVQDNGTGIPVKQEDGYYIPYLAWGQARAGSNFDDDENRTQIGMNGVGSFATNCFSKKFIGISDDGKNRYSVTFNDNASDYIEKVGVTKGKPGVTVQCWPDLEKFGLTEVDETHMLVIHQRLINLSMTYPEITFRFNNRKVNINSFKKFISLFNEISEIFETDDYKIAILPNAEDDFRQFSYVNGLNMKSGGEHVNFIVNNLVGPLRDKLLRKYKTIKPADIKNKMMIVAFLKNFKNMKNDSQTKESITNSTPEVRAYYGDIPFTQIVNKLFKNSAFMDPITEVYRIKEEFKKRQELKGLKKSIKKIKSEKYLPSIGTKKYLLLVEGESALGGLSPVLGRKECGYYCLKGKPLNAYSAPQAKFTANKELSELFKIIQNENYQQVIFATDQDLDGYHIRGLLTGFFFRYMPEMKTKLGMLQTPVIGVSKGDKLIRWYYNLSDKIELRSGEHSNYYKGLGSWSSEDLKEVVKKDGLKKMIDMLEFDSDNIVDEWLGSNSEPRKKYILANDFSIAKL